jgi:hypothetical protein
MPFDNETIRRALDAKGALGECPACGASDPWEAAEWPTTLTPVDLERKVVLAPTGEMQSLVFFVVGCNNCGFARLHRTTILFGLQ